MKDYFGYKGKACVITGAASGMAQAAAEMLVDLGAQVYALDWAEVTTPGVTKSIKVDLSNKDSIDAAFAEIPEKIDSYFGVAGVSGQQHDYNKTFTINFIANKYITEAYLKDRVKPGGAIAYITSTAGMCWEKYLDEIDDIVKAEGWEATVKALESKGMKEVPGDAAYPISKRAVHYYATLNVGYFALNKIRVNYLLPASTDTALKDDFAKTVGGMENLLKYTGFAQRLAEAREMAEPLVFLNSDMASYIAGVGLYVDYGAYAPIALGQVPNPLDTPMLPPKE